MKNSFYPAVEETISSLPIHEIPADRMSAIDSMVNYVLGKIKANEQVRLNFICTHNSRRSQFSQIWAQTAADYLGIEVSSYSGGVEVTAFNERAVAAIRRDGFKVVQKGEENPVYFVFHGEASEPIVTFSKVYDDPINPNSGFAAVMTCDHADKNCPIIPGAETRLPLRFEDPKTYDGTDFEERMYTERSHQIGAEVFLIFKKVKENL
ncbi:protein-tyrosine-phosphatase [Algoriphagus aestuariicola]|jgi:arsenate reductase|uniref:Protein-tyrosine-phosphatase n=1 Tax=Algoriphagus aestuariicola TaxID=1852016 RepID=A0ABS3BPL8_9BACT|nr:protein-tyrosine-phosphatase [Algoriphagus aestuariicola]MBN7800977.1 protein-tyrosine-phosphatase [Algoriphagus aestuariicola]